MMVMNYYFIVLLIPYAPLDVYSALLSVRLANAVRLTLNPSSVTDVEGVRDVALALKATKKVVPKERAEAAAKNKKSGAEDETEPQPLTPNSPRSVLYLYKISLCSDLHGAPFF